MTQLARIRSDRRWALLIYPAAGLLGGSAILCVIALATVPRNSAAGFVPLTLIVTLIGGIFGAAVGFVGALVEQITLQKSFARSRSLVTLAVSTFAASAILYLLAFSVSIGPNSVLAAALVATISSLGFTAFGWAFWRRATPDLDAQS